MAASLVSTYCCTASAVTPKAGAVILVTKYLIPLADGIDAAYKLTALAKHIIRCDLVAYVTDFFLPISAPPPPDKEEEDSN
eukprot:12985616-Ditylum_brightwellii.AAC.1